MSLSEKIDTVYDRKEDKVHVCSIEDIRVVVGRVKFRIMTQDWSKLSMGESKTRAMEIIDEEFGKRLSK